MQCYARSQILLLDNFLDNSRAQSTVELALLTPVIFVLLLWVAQFGLVVNHKITVTHAAREAARAVAIHNDPKVALEAALASGNFEKDRLRVTVDPQLGQLVTVKLSYAFPTDIPLVGDLIGDINLSSSISMRAEG